MIKIPRKLVLALGLLSVAAFLAGCIEFQRQSLSYHYDTATDTLKIFQDYHGIFGGSDEHKLTPDETEQLASVLDGQRTFFFNNWISEINHAQLRETLGNLKDPQHQKEQKLDAPAISHIETLINLLLDNARIENGPFYLDAEGKLSAVQRVTITKTSKLIAAGNEVIRDAFKAEIRKDETTAEERLLYRQSTEQQQDYIKLEGNRLGVRLPMTRAKYDEMFGPKAENRQMNEELKKNGGAINFTRDEVTLSFGQPTDNLTSITLSVSEKTYTTNMLDVVKKRALVREKFDAQAAAREFLSINK
jgi:hypothetical protein